MINSKCAVLFSGGTDSLCAAALCCEKYEEVQLLTFYESATKSSPIPTENVNRLKKKYPAVNISHHIISTDSFTRRLSYENYFMYLMKFHFFNLATPGLSSLGWHIATVLHCKQNQISTACDGMTRELLHLPGHMPEIRSLFEKLYQENGIDFSGPVIEWDVPIDQRFIDKLIVDRHGFGIFPAKPVRSTGQWLYDNGILPHPNVKGSLFDRLMQHDCYPFVVYNMLVFWLLEPIIGFEKIKHKLQSFIEAKLSVGRRLIAEGKIQYEVESK